MIKAELFIGYYIDSNGCNDEWYSVRLYMFGFMTEFKQSTHIPNITSFNIIKLF
jgi:hypothetical protein